MFIAKGAKSAKKIGSSSGVIADIGGANLCGERPRISW
jgi:hypothetical protein